MDHLMKWDRNKVSMKSDYNLKTGNKLSMKSDYNVKTANEMGPYVVSIKTIS